MAESAQAHDDDPRPPETPPGAGPPEPRQIGRFEVERAFEPGAGALYVALDRGSGRRVTLQILDPSSSDRAVRDAKALAPVASEHLVKLLEAAPEGSPPHLALEAIDGPSLAQVLAKRHRLPHDEALKVGLAVSRGLEAAHAAGVLHGDVKPSNILVARAGTVKLTGFVSGTDAEADVHALGRVIYQVLTGELPNADGRLVPPGERVPGLPPRVERACTRLLSADASDRVKTAAAACELLERAIRGGTSSAVSSSDLRLRPETLNLKLAEPGARTSSGGFGVAAMKRGPTRVDESSSVQTFVLAVAVVVIGIAVVVALAQVKRSPAPAHAPPPPPTVGVPPPPEAPPPPEEPEPAPPAVLPLPAEGPPPAPAPAAHAPTPPNVTTPPAELDPATRRALEDATKRGPLRQIPLLEALDTKKLPEGVRRGVEQAIRDLKKVEASLNVARGKIRDALVAADQFALRSAVDEFMAANPRVPQPLVPVYTDAYRNLAALRDEVGITLDFHAQQKRLLRTDYAAKHFPVATILDDLADQHISQQVCRATAAMAAAAKVPLPYKLEPNWEKLDRTLDELDLERPSIKR